MRLGEGAGRPGFKRLRALSAPSSSAPRNGRWRDLVLRAAAAGRRTRGLKGILVLAHDTGEIDASGEIDTRIYQGRPRYDSCVLMKTVPPLL